MVVVVDPARSTGLAPRPPQVASTFSNTDGGIYWGNWRLPKAASLPSRLLSKVCT